MSHLERLFAALYVSEAWQALFEAKKILRPGMRPLYYKTCAIVVYDRVLTDRAEPTLIAGSKQ